MTKKVSSALQAARWHLAKLTPEQVKALRAQFGLSRALGEGGAAGERKGAAVRPREKRSKRKH